MKVKTCPFCGGKAIIKQRESGGTTWWKVTCMNANCFIRPETGEEENKEDIIKAWNRRIPIFMAVKRLEDVAKHRRNTFKQMNASTESFRMKGYVNGLEKAAEIVKGYTE